MTKITITNTQRTVLETLRESFQLPQNAVCNGNGTCGKCKIKILSGTVPPPDTSEKKHISEDEFANGIRLACRITPKTQLEIEVDLSFNQGQILESNEGFTGILNPLIKKRHIQLKKPDIHDQRSDITRILESLELNEHEITLETLHNIPQILEQSNYNISVSYSDKKIISIVQGNSEDENYSIACDIGTTTVVVYLLNNNTGVIIDTYSELNAQKPYGADVISRIDYTINNNDGLKILQNIINNQLTQMTIKILKRKNIDSQNLNSFIVAANTTMLHLLVGINPKTIATAPFIPVFLDTLNCQFKALTNFPTECELYLLPSISAYVGSDIVAGVLATNMYKSEEISLLLDLGTNGEIILGNMEEYFSCSTAAGPAFEGAHISFGTGATDGAVSTFSLSKDINYTTIGNKKAIGICGSAIIDITSEFIINGIIDETGRFDEEFLKTDPRYISDGEGAYVIVQGSETLNGKDITFSQKDIREVQLAKASISAGIETLIKESGINRDSIKKLYIAGGFGNYIDKNSSAQMGLIPKDLLSISTSVGNTSGLGAIHCSLSSEKMEICRNIVTKTTYIELSSSSYFQDQYIEGMMF